MRKEKLFLYFLGLILAGPFAHATTDVSSSILDQGEVIEHLDKSGQLGVGVQGGSQSGVNLQYWTAESRAVDLKLTAEHGNAGVGFAHLWMFRGAFPGDVTPLVPYVGVGALAVFGRSNDFLKRTGSGDVVGALEIPLGFEFLVRRFGLFGEASPAFQFAPVFHDFVLADLGARYYF